MIKLSFWLFLMKWCDLLNHLVLWIGCVNIFLKILWSTYDFADGALLHGLEWVACAAGHVFLVSHALPIDGRVKDAKGRRGAALRKYNIHAWIKVIHIDIVLFLFRHEYLWFLGLYETVRWWMNQGRPWMKGIRPEKKHSEQRGSCRYKYICRASP